MDKRHIFEEIRRTTEENHGEPLGLTSTTAAKILGVTR
jgi:hypothetical protein